MRIVHVANAWAAHSGGIRTTLRALGTGYREAGHELVVVTPGGSPEDISREWGRHVVLPGLAVPGSGGYRALTRLRPVTDLLDALRPDRLEVSDRLTLRGLGDWARSAGVPSTVFLHEQLAGVLAAFSPFGPDRWRPVVDRHNAGTVERFDRVVTTTRFAARELERIGAATEHVPLGVDLALFRPRLRAVRPPDAPLVVVCSRLSREKRPDLAVDALDHLARRGVRARLVVAGDGPARRTLQRMARGRPVTFVGHLPERRAVADLLGAADVVLAPGPIETFGLAALEALACGTPVVAARTSALAELVVGDAGAVADPDPAALADAVAQVLAVPPARRRAAARARAEEFPWDRTTARLLALHGAAA
ncbi:glycosyltransferase [Lapillicoccus jejuensis]|uniref:D-inositol 3-phosphate glycosyltransferase n=1 Tax=Lapillicoccus jejuensis TaxID=402171 RepID=A0A542E0H2_9MICO|nr:glycosyltransferase [Lapillicoccus jejuensis]TQJ08779.1 alpha-1,6-mannosyltransferase [Lapillicoccus jejuensis]